MISHHPTSEMLLEFSEAIISTATSVAVSAHLALCQRCKSKAEDMEAGLAEGLLGHTLDSTVHTTGSGDAEIDLDAMMSAITAQAPSVGTAESTITAHEIVVGDLAIKIPAVLGKLAANLSRWKHYRNGISLANVPVDNISQCDFLYMKPGGKVPMHTHGGSEITLVLDGQFEDDDGVYNVGDFLVRDASVTHTTETKEGCLCFTVLEQPVIFKKGLARVLNFFNRRNFPMGQTQL
jgi:putative transcriptional regulator